MAPLETQEAPSLGLSPPQNPQETSPLPSANEAIDLGSAVTFRENVAKGDGFLELSIAEDGMSAFADLYPPVATGAILDIAQARELLGRLGIVAGIDWDGLSEAILRCNLDRCTIRNQLVARGKNPVPIVNEHALAEMRLRAKPAPAPETLLRYDFHDRIALIIVRKGETLAKIIPSSKGEEGFDIRGKVVAPPHRESRGVIPGKNCARDEDRLVAKVDGLLVPLTPEGTGRLDIEEILLIHGDVDFHTGHIVFPGDVVIDGQVGDGFKVWSGGSIRCKTTMDAFDVNAKKDLICDQGIIGRRRAQVRVGRELRAKFVQNCRLAVRGDIHIQTAIVNSRVYTLGRIDLGDKGVFMGGEAYAVHGLRANRLGNQAHQATIVHVGTDFTVQQRLDQANERLRVLALKAQRAKEESGGVISKALEFLLSKTAEAEASLHSMIGELLASLDADDGAVIEITGDVFPGTV